VPPFRRHTSAPVNSHIRAASFRSPPTNAVANAPTPAGRPPTTGPARVNTAPGQIWRWPTGRQRPSNNGSTPSNEPASVSRLVLDFWNAEGRVFCSSWHMEPMEQVTRARTRTRDPVILCYVGPAVRTIHEAGAGYWERITVWKIVCLVDFHTIMCST
jgi:hypothetical protein